MHCPRYLPALILILSGLSACAPATDRPVAQPAAGAGLAPPPGRTAEETANRRAYYHTPRGDEF